MTALIDTPTIDIYQSLGEEMRQSDRKAFEAVAAEWLIEHRKKGYEGYRERVKSGTVKKAQPRQLVEIPASPEMRDSVRREIACANRMDRSAARRPHIKYWTEQGFGLTPIARYLGIDYDTIRRDVRPSYRARRNEANRIRNTQEAAA